MSDWVAMGIEREALFEQAVGISGSWAVLPIQLLLIFGGDDQCG
jgi:hypothetical protein